MKTLRLVAAIIASTSLLFVACSNSSSSTQAAASGTSTTSSPSTADTLDAATYADGFCSALGVWVNGIQDGNKTYQDAISQGTASMQEVKDALGAYVDDAVARTDALLDQVHALGTPDVPNGEQVAQSLVDGLQSARDVYAQVADTIHSLSTSDAGTMTQQLNKITTDMTQAFKELSSAFASIDSPELEAAGKDAPACQDL